MVAKSCTTLDGWNPINNGMFTTYQLVLSSIHRVFLATCHWISFLPPSDRRRLMSSWWRSWSSWAAGHAMQPVHPKKNKPSGGFCWGRFCWVYVEFMLSLLWLALGWLSDLGQPFKFADLGNHGIPFGFLRDFPLISPHKGIIISPRKRVGPCPTDVQESWIERGGAGTPKPVWVWLQPPTLGPQGGCRGSRDSWRFFDNGICLDAWD
jgi:hypothetical protein